MQHRRRSRHSLTSGPPRRRYTVKERHDFVEEYFRVKASSGISLRGCAFNFGVDKNSLRKWIKDHTNLKIHKKTSLSMKGGCASQLEPISSKLLQFIFERREQGFTVSRNAVILQASSLSAEFSTKSSVAKMSAIRRWLKSQDLVYRLGTHESQRAPHVAIQDSLDFIKVVRPLFHGPSRDPRFILNMDQTPVYYSMHSDRTLEVRGAKTVNTRTAKNESHRITVAVTISAAGDLLQPTIIFKGTFITVN